MLSLAFAALHKRRAAKAAIHQRNIFQQMECDSVHFCTSETGQLTRKRSWMVLK
jgi:hypothetical protein